MRRAHHADSRAEEQMQKALRQQRGWSGKGTEQQAVWLKRARRRVAGGEGGSDRVMPYHSHIVHDLSAMTIHWGFKCFEKPLKCVDTGTG